MPSAICRYGPRVIPNTNQTTAAMRRAGTLVQGPQIAEFEDALARRLGVSSVATASYGRMAFYYLLKAFDFSPGDEVIIPALTFWAVPEIVRVAGLTPVFADVDPRDFTIDVRIAERLVTDRTRAIVPTHLYGWPCDMDAVERLAVQYNLRVIEDSAHALGATYRGRPAGTLGDASFFSFQTLKPLNTYRGGAAYARDPAIASRVRTLATSEPWPTPSEVYQLLLMGKAQRVFTRPHVFSWTAFPILWCASLLHARPDVYLWESIRPLVPLPSSYTKRYTNVQAAIGLEGLRHLEGWTTTTRAHAKRLDTALAEAPGVAVPHAEPGREHAYYQYCVYVPDRSGFVTRCLRRGVDVETLHMDVCTRLPLFGSPRLTPGAERGDDAIQLPIYQSLTDHDMDRVIAVVQAALSVKDVHAAPVAHTRGPESSAATS